MRHIRRNAGNQVAWNADHFPEIWLTDNAG